MVEPLRHRQSKEAATDMFSLQPPRHIPTLPEASFRYLAPIRPKSRVKPTCRDSSTDAIDPIAVIRASQRAVRCLCLSYHR